jgi:hypothetical protein
MDGTKMVAISFRTLLDGCLVIWVVDLGVSYTNSLGGKSTQCLECCLAWNIALISIKEVAMESTLAIPTPSCPPYYQWLPSNLHLA